MEQQARNGQALADVIRARVARRVGGDGQDGGGTGPEDQTDPMRRARPSRLPLRSGAAGTEPAAGFQDMVDMVELAEMAERWFPRGDGTTG